MQIGEIALAVCGPCDFRMGKFDDGKTWRVGNVSYLGGSVKVEAEDEVHEQLLPYTSMVVEVMGLASVKVDKKGNGVLAITRVDKVLHNGQVVWQRSGRAASKAG